MIWTELTKHRASPGKFFICVRVISDKATLPSVEILKLRIQFTGEKCFFVMQKARNLTIGVFIVGKNNSIDATLVVFVEPRLLEGGSQCEPLEDARLAGTFACLENCCVDLHRLAVLSAIGAA